MKLSNIAKRKNEEHFSPHAKKNLRSQGLKHIQKQTACINRFKHLPAPRLLIA